MVLRDVLGLNCMLSWFGRAARGLQMAAMQQIADWLKNLGMSEDAGCFADNRIDASVPSLTDDSHGRYNVRI